jgi:hypothetical protein
MMDDVVRKADSQSQGVAVIDGQALRVPPIVSRTGDPRAPLGLEAQPLAVPVAPKPQVAAPQPGYTAPRDVDLNDVILRNTDMPHTKADVESAIDDYHSFGRDSEFPWVGQNPERELDLREIDAFGTKITRSKVAADRARRGENPLANFTSAVDEDGQLRFWPKNSFVDEIVNNVSAHVDADKVALPITREKLDYIATRLNDPAPNAFKARITKDIQAAETLLPGTLITKPAEEVERIIAMTVPPKVQTAYSTALTASGQTIDDVLRRSGINQQEYMDFLKSLGPRANAGNIRAWLRVRCGR